MGIPGIILLVYVATFLGTWGAYSIPEVMGHGSRSAAQALSAACWNYHRAFVVILKWMVIVLGASALATLAVAVVITAGVVVVDFIWDFQVHFSTYRHFFYHDGWIAMASVCGIFLFFGLFGLMAQNEDW